MRQNTVLQLIGKLYRKTLDLPDPHAHQLRPDHNMPQKLPGVRIIILRKRRQLIYLPDIVAHGSRIQKICIQHGIGTHIILAQLCDAQRMLQQSAHKTMVHALGRTAELECLYKLLVIYKDSLQKLRQPGIFHPVHKAQELRIHLFDIFSADRKIIRRVVFPFLRFPHPLHVQLQLPLEAGYIRHDVHIVKSFKCLDSSGIRIPDLGIHGPCLILQDHIFIGLPGLCQRRLTGFAQIDPADPLAFP